MLSNSRYPLPFIIQSRLPSLPSLPRPYRNLICYPHRQNLVLTPLPQNISLSNQNVFLGNPTQHFFRTLFDFPKVFPIQSSSSKVQIQTCFSGFQAIHQEAGRLAKKTWDTVKANRKSQQVEAMCALRKRPENPSGMQRGQRL